MSFTDNQVKALEAPLSKSNVKKNPRGYDYVEGWHAIAEANRIFGFAAWDRETLDMRQIMEAEKVGDNWRVAYHCRVRVTVRAGDVVVVRDGSGYGSGIGKDGRDVHESAIKEAETDALKRALMTFGNPFGLALYDKAKTNVESPAPKTSPVSQAAISDLLKEQVAFIADCASIIAKSTDAEALGAWWKSDEQMQARRRLQLDNTQVDALKQAVINKHAELTKEPA